MSDGSDYTKEGRLSRLSVVLLRTREASNIGAVARVMANFGIRNATLVAPRCDSSCVDARENATGSGAVTLATMRVVKSFKELASENHILVAVTTSMPVDSALVLSYVDVVGKLQNVSVSLVFGPEETGLSETDLKHCSHVLRLPVAECATNLNLSHAVGIVLSRFFEETL
ncbi:MAG: TrmH family RNA methyltransferase [Pseudomonadota bacterium]